MRSPQRIDFVRVFYNVSSYFLNVDSQYRVVIFVIHISKNTNMTGPVVAPYGKPYICI